MASGRFAPSPTGPLHLGNLRTALLAWLFARSAGSAFSVRMEDLDPLACRPEHVAGQLRDLAALGLDWDGPVVTQSARRSAHEAALQHLIAAGHTYPCYCSRREIREAALAPNGADPEGRYPGTCRRLPVAQRARREAQGRRPALRLQGGAVPIAFEDRVHGRVEGTVDDVVLRRNDGTPAYNLAVVVDDAAMAIEEVVRGEDLLAVTATQIHLCRLLGLPVPVHAHVALLRGADGQRLAKRHGAVTLAQRLALGQSPQEVRAELAASVGLAAPGQCPTTATLLERFGALDPTSLSGGP